MKVMLNFDDGCSSHYKVVLPLLEAVKFKATFFIGTILVGHPGFMDWKQILRLYGLGHEIGNHMVHHNNSPQLPDAMITQEIQGNQKTMKQFGIPKPIVIAYTGFHCDARVAKIAQDTGCRFGRIGTGNEANEHFGASGIDYNPAIHDPLQIPCKGVFGQRYGFEEFKKDLDSVEYTGVFTFHDVLGHTQPDSIMPNDRMLLSIPDLERSISYVKEKECEVICYRDLI